MEPRWDLGDSTAGPLLLDGSRTGRVGSAEDGDHPSERCPNSSQTNGSSPLWFLLVMLGLVPSELSAAFLQAHGHTTATTWGSPEIFREVRCPPALVQEW